MLDTAAVVAHAGEESLYVLVPLLVLFIAWRVWDRLRNGVPTEPDGPADDAARNDEGQHTTGRDDPGDDGD